MKFIAKTLILILLNAGVFILITKVVPGFSLEAGFPETLSLALVFTILNYLLKPVLKLILGPIIILTLGLGLILVNMLILYILDSLSNNLTIEGVLNLFYASLIVGLINFFIHLAFKDK